MKKKSLMLLILLWGSSTHVFAAKAICTAKNLQTNQIYQVAIGKQSYAVARKESARLALTQCAQSAYQTHYCRLNGCYKR